jgi:hypothetical protein
MNDRGGMLILIVVALVGSVVILPIMMSAFEPLNIIVRIILAFTIITTVRGYIGNGVLSILISGILIYFLVIKWWFVASPVWLFTVFMGLNIIGMIVWGLGTSKIVTGR